MTPSVSTTAVPVVLDDGPPSPLLEQQRLFADVERIGVPVRKVINMLRREPGRGLLIRERRAVHHLRLASAGRPLSKAVERAFRVYGARLKVHDIPVPDAVYEAMSALLGALEVPVNHLTDRLEGSPGIPIGRDRTPERYASDRRALQKRGRLHARIAPGANLSAIQQRYMRTVRKAVHEVVLAALLKGTRDAVHVVAGRAVPTSEADRSRVHAAADYVASAIVRTLYPTWGATTTPELVRKAVTRRRRA